MVACKSIVSAVLFIDTVVVVFYGVIVSMLN